MPTVPKQVRERTFELMQDDQRLVAPAVEALDQFRRREVAAANEAASEGESDDNGGGRRLLMRPRPDCDIALRGVRPSHVAEMGSDVPAGIEPASHRHSHAVPL